MGNEPKTTPSSDDSASRLKNIESLLDDNEALRKKKSQTSLVGVLVILTLFGIFIFRLYSHGETVISQRNDIAKKVWEETEPMITHEATLLRTELQETAIPDLSQAMMSAFKADMPKFEAEGREMGGRLYDHGRQTVEAVLIETLAASIEKSGEDLEGVFPEFSSTRLEAQLSASGELFTELAYEVIEERIARVGTSLDGLKASVKKVADSDGAEVLDKERLDWAEDEVISAMVDLVVYELKPDLGDEPADEKDAGDTK